MPKPYHLQKPQNRHTVTSCDKQLTLYLDDSTYQLRIKPRHARQTYSLDSVALLALCNMLVDEYKAISQEARKYNGITGSGPKSTEVTSFCGM